MGIDRRRGGHGLVPGRGAAADATEPRAGAAATPVPVVGAAADVGDAMSDCTSAAASFDAETRSLPLCDVTWATSPGRHPVPTEVGFSYDIDLPTVPACDSACMYTWEFIQLNRQGKAARREP